MRSSPILEWGWPHHGRGLELTSPVNGTFSSAMHGNHVCHAVMRICFCLLHFQFFLGFVFGRLTFWLWCAIHVTLNTKSDILWRFAISKTFCDVARQNVSQHWKKLWDMQRHFEMFHTCKMAVNLHFDNSAQKLCWVFALTGRFGTAHVLCSMSFEHLSHSQTLWVIVRHFVTFFDVARCFTTQHEVLRHRWCIEGVLITCAADCKKAKTEFVVNDPGAMQVSSTMNLSRVGEKPNWAHVWHCLFWFLACQCAGAWNGVDRYGRRPRQMQQHQLFFHGGKRAICSYCYSVNWLLP